MPLAIEKADLNADHPRCEGSAPGAAYAAVHGDDVGKDAGQRRGFAVVGEDGRVEGGGQLDESSAVAVSDGEAILGFGSCGPNRGDRRFAGEVFTLYVAPDWQNQGIGRRLLMALFRRLVFNRIRSVFGTRLRYLISGGAPLSLEVNRLLAAAEVPIVEGCKRRRRRWRRNRPMAGMGG